jgi:hypothetical protein
MTEEAKPEILTPEQHLLKTYLVMASVGPASTIKRDIIRTMLNDVVRQGIEEAAAEVATHWNYRSTTVNQKEQAGRSKCALLSLALRRKPLP